VLGLLASLLLGPPPLPDDAPDEQLAVGLRWDGPPECAGWEPLHARLLELLPEVTVGDEGAIAVGVRLSSVADGWAVVVEVGSELGVDRRELVAESCAVAIDASALVIAVALDPIAVTHELERLRAAEPKPEPEAEPEPEADPEPEAEPELEPRYTISSDPPPEPPRSWIRRWNRRHLQAGLAVLGGGGYGPLQGGSGILLARVALHGRAWRWELRGGWLPPIVHDVRVPTVDDERRIRVDGWLIGTRGCGVPKVGLGIDGYPFLGFPLCAGIEAGGVRGAPLDPITNRRTATQPWVAAEAGPGLYWAPRPRLALGLEVAAVVPFVTGGFALDGERVLGVAPVGVRALAGIELRLP
jgi:hypothetical protein